MLFIDRILHKYVIILPVTAIARNILYNIHIYIYIKIRRTWPPLVFFNIILKDFIFKFMIFFVLLKLKECHSMSFNLPFL